MQAADMAALRRSTERLRREEVKRKGPFVASLRVARRVSRAWFRVMHPLCDAPLHFCKYRESFKPCRLASSFSSSVRSLNRSLPLRFRPARAAFLCVTDVKPSTSSWAPMSRAEREERAKRFKGQCEVSPPSRALLTSRGRPCRCCLCCRIRYQSRQRFTSPRGRLP